MGICRIVHLSAYVRQPIRLGPRFGEKSELAGFPEVASGKDVGGARGVTGDESGAKDGCHLARASSGRRDDKGLRRFSGD